MTERHRVLFLCTGNSCRSQMAEAIVNARLGDRWEAFSAGTAPAASVHPHALRVLAEIGIVHDGRSKHADTYRDVPFDLVVTVCDDAVEACPVWLGRGRRVHLGLPDPAGATGADDEVVTVFRRVRDDIARDVPALLAAWDADPALEAVAAPPAPGTDDQSGCAAGPTHMSADPAVEPTSLPDPATAVERSAPLATSGTVAASGLTRFAAVLVVGVLVVFAIAMLVARARGGAPSGGDVTNVASSAVRAAGPQTTMQRIAGVAELPSGAVEHVEVAYFHRTHRCSGCINAERLTRETLETRFADRLASGDINLVVEDTEAPGDPELVRRYEAWGSALYLSVTKGGTAYTWRVDDVWFYVNEDHKFIGVLGDQIRAIYGEP